MPMIFKDDKVSITILQNIIVNIAKSITEIPANLLLYSFISTTP